MNRTIKFRIWSINNKQWLFPNPNIGDHLAGNGNAINLWCYPDGLSVHGVSKECVIFQQFIGLKDKNSREIYEGDIVLVEYYSSVQDKYVINKDVVCFQHGAFILKDINLYLKENYGGATIPNSRDIEVIGNILENPKQK